MNYWGDTGNKSKMTGVLRNGVPVPQTELTYLTDDFTREAVNYIDIYSKKENPFFMYLAYNAPHAPIQATTEYLDLMAHQEYGGRAAYGAMVVGMDAGIGKVIAKLKETGEFENTLIFFFSDNGGHVLGARSEPFRGHKGMLFEGGIRVPFLVSWPNGIKGGDRYLKSISALDIYPTILAATGIQYPNKEQLDGVNLLPFISGENKNTPHDILFWRYSNGAGYAVQKGKYKMVMSGYKNDFLLFDLENDPYEHHNLALQQPDKLAELKSDYAGWNKQNIPAKWYDPHLENVKKEELKRQSFIDKASAGERMKK
jgi:arylsulfatase A-like enzyme